MHFRMYLKQEGALYNQGRECVFALIINKFVNGVAMYFIFYSFANDLLMIKFIPMKNLLLLFAFVALTYTSYGQSNIRQNLAKQINELFFTSVDSNLNQIVNVDRLGTVNIMFKAKDENVDFNILDISNMELEEPHDETPYLTIAFHCHNCMHLTSPSEDRRKQFESSTFTLPVKYKALGMKLISKLEELRRQNR